MSENGMGYAQQAQSPISEFSDEIIQNLGVYVCLVDESRIVKKTNFYNITREPKPTKEVRLGNLLRCKNGEDAGLCGEGEQCKYCGIRNIIEKSFQNHCGFQGVEEDMILYTSPRHEESIDCRVNVSGKFLEDKSQMVLTIRDVTHDKEMVEARKKAERENQEKSIFVANMSHEMRTPLNAILGFSELMAFETDETQKNEFLKIVRANSNILLQLVNDILDLTNIEAGMMTITEEEFNFNKMMEELESTYRLYLKNHGQQVELNYIPGRALCHLRTEQKHVRQVISNLLSNAVKNTIEGEITFGYEVRQNGIYCFVKDTGIGIPEDKQHLIFDRFSKLDVNKQGAGLGLAISKMIVNKLGGRIGVSSRMGEGSTFWFTLPILPLEAAFEKSPDDAVPVACETCAGKQLLIWAADDEQYEKMNRALSPIYTVNRALTGEEALVGFLNNMADAVVIGVQPNDTSGDCVAALRQLSSRLPIVAVGDADNKELCMAAGFTCFVSEEKIEDQTFRTVFCKLFKNY